MAKVYEFLANGFEEIEALAPVDILRRGGIEVKTVSITGSEYAESSHGITIKA
ncbi:MAG: DJ-1/PfpI family protein, partial [Prevotella sp.]